MSRPSRTFTLNLSPGGVELLLDCHHRLCRLTNELLPYGQTLYAAVLHLATLDEALILDDVETLKRSGLAGSKTCFVGAPTRLVEVVALVAERTRNAAGSRRLAIRTSQLFLVALKRFRLAESLQLLGAYHEMRALAGDSLRMPGRQRSQVGGGLPAPTE